MAELAARETVEVAVSAHRLWALRHDFTRLPEYNPSVGAITCTVPAGADGAGARYEFTLTTPAGPHPVSLVVTEVVGDRLVAADMFGAMSARERFTVEVLGPDRCRAELSLWLELPGDLSPELRERLLANGRREIRGELDAMREVLEPAVT